MPFTQPHVLPPHSRNEDSWETRCGALHTGRRLPGGGKGGGDFSQALLPFSQALLACPPCRRRKSAGDPAMAGLWVYVGFTPEVFTPWHQPFCAVTSAVYEPWHRPLTCRDSNCLRAVTSTVLGPCPASAFCQTECMRLHGPLQRPETLIRHLRRGETQDSLYCNFINLVQLQNEGPLIFFGTSIRPFHVLMTFLWWNDVFYDG